MLLKERAPIPPLSTQARTSELLDQEHVVAQSLARTIRFIDEYRARLVADVVTGRLDVREVAAGLIDDIAPEDAAVDDESLNDEDESEEVEAAA
jgi:type I restriction enzyme S subunit